MSINTSHKIVILINSKSGGGKGLKLFKKLESLIQKHNIDYDVYIDNWIDSLENHKAIWLIGGDGTLNYLINKYRNINIPVALFKGGTGNDFSWKLYGDISLEEQIEKILQGNEKFVDAGLCNERLFLNGVGIGFDGEILKNMQSIRWLGGHLGYLLIVIAKIFNFKEHCFKVTMNNETAVEKLFLMSVFNSSRTGGGFYIAPKALINDGLLDVIQCKPLGIIDRLKNLPVIERGNHLSLPFINYTNQQTIIVECQQELPAQIDGELFFAQHYHIEILPNRFKFLY